MRLPFLSLPLRYFLEVARTGSVNQAAQQLHVAASAVSRQLAKLEDSLGVVLFERQNRGMALTAAGERLLAYASAGSEEGEQVAEQLRGLAQQQRQHVRLACTEGFASGFMPQVMAAFRAQYPEAQLQLRVVLPDEVNGLVQRGEVDLAMKYSLAPEKGVRQLHSAIAPICAVMAARHPLARQRQVTVVEVLRYPLLMGPASMTARRLFDLSCSMQGLVYTAAVVSDFSASLLPLIGARDVALASYLTAARWVEAGVLAARPFAEAQLQQRRLQVLALEGRALPPLAEQFAQGLVAAIEQYGKRKLGRRRPVAARQAGAQAAAQAGSAAVL